MDDEVIKAPEFLSGNHTPACLIGRESQIQEITCCLRPALYRRKPINAWLYGEPGSGKTAAVKYVLKQMQDQGTIQGIYINCWENDSLYAICDKLIRDLKILFAERPDANLKLERFRERIGSKPFVIVLDEIDTMAPKERNRTLYIFAGMDNIGLICISNSLGIFLSLDKRIQSRLSPRQICFNSYSSADLFSILKQRAELALSPNSCNEEIIQKICDLAEGDARVGIQTLRKAAEVAASFNSDRIQCEHVDKAWNSTKDLKQKYLLDSLTAHHRIIYDIVHDSPGCSSNHIRQVYLHACKVEDRKPIATRTFSLYLNRLISLKLIHFERTGKNCRNFHTV
jgi:orc1/cdc6 family replication initiation protein